MSRIEVDYKIKGLAQTRTVEYFIESSLNGALLD